MEIYFSVECPYCHHVNRFAMKKESAPIKLAVYYCELEEGGCDLPFVVGVELKPVVTTESIVGMAEQYQEDVNERELATHTLPGE